MSLYTTKDGQAWVLATPDDRYVVHVTADVKPWGYAGYNVRGGLDKAIAKADRLGKARAKQLAKR